MVISWVDIIFFFAAVFISVSYFFTDVLILRLLSIVGALGYILGGYIAGYQVAGMTTLIIFSAVNFLVNLLQSIRIILDRKPILLPDELKEIYSKTFQTMTPNEFLKFYQLAKIQTAHKNEVITKQSATVPHLILIKDGRAKVIKDNHKIASLNNGFFVGEMSFLTGDLANATVEVDSDNLSYLVWDKDKLNKMKIKNSSLFEKLKQVLATNLIKKIDQHVQHEMNEGLQ